MKYNIIRIAAILLIVGVLVTMGFLKKPADTLPPPAGKGFAVVELFTSEGCSSCPAADAELEKTALAYPDNVYVLGFHVDYWNRLGWKDVFSDAAYSARQRTYVDQFKLEGAYTPQAVVNGKTQMVGSDALQLKKAVDAEINGLVNPYIKLAATSNGGTVQVKCQSLHQPGTVIHFALVQRAAQTDVRQGENQGRQLHHINIVRDFKTTAATANETPAILPVPAGISAKDCEVIAYIQQTGTGVITAAASCNIQ